MRGQAKVSVSKTRVHPSISPVWQWLALLLVLILIPWATYIIYHPSFEKIGKLVSHELEFDIIAQKIKSAALIDTSISSSTQSAKETLVQLPHPSSEKLPVLGPIPTDGAKPLYGFKHQGGDAIFALATNYPKQFYQRFVGSLRKTGYTDDIVLAVSPPIKMKPGVESYIKEMKIIGYAFDVDCIGKDNCKLTDDFLGYPDPRPHRTFANIRYALYEYWLRNYSPASFILILDFRDTFFQQNPFTSFGPLARRDPAAYVLQLYAENSKVMWIILPTLSE